MYTLDIRVVHLQQIISYVYIESKIFFMQLCFKRRMAKDFTEDFISHKRLNSFVCPGMTEWCHAGHEQERHLGRGVPCNSMPITLNNTLYMGFYCSIGNTKFSKMGSYLIA